MTDPGPSSLLRNLYFFLLILFLAGCSPSSTLKKAETPKTDGKPQFFYDQPIPNDQGMWLMPQVSGPVYDTLKSKGLQLAPHAIYHPDSASLNKSVAKINIAQNSSGSGAFVSDKGLLLTNHHVAYSAITGSKSSRTSYLEEGFYAQNRNKEIPLTNYNLLITLEQKEVTDRINSKLPDSLNYREKYIRSRKIRKQLINERKGNNNDLVVEINDFWGGNRQFMSVYRVIRDVRLVYAPPESIGKFGGNIDNWEWPRHTGDFAFLRAYVSPDGGSAPYAESNVPYTPESHLKINPEGVSPGDFTMVLGYPGQTFRNESSYAFEFYYNHRNPILIEMYQAMLDALNHAAKQSEQRAKETAARRASLENSLKYLRGIQRGFKKHDITGKKRAIETRFNKWIKKDSARFVRYRRVLDQLDQAYNIAGQTGELLYGVVNTLNNSKLLQIAGLYSSYDQYLADSTKSDLDKASKDSLLAKHQKILDSINVEAQQKMLEDMLYSLASMPEGKVMFYLMKLFEGAQREDLRNQIENYIARQTSESIVFNPKKAKKFLDLPADSARKLQPDKMITLYQEILDSYRFSRKNYIQHIPYQRPAHERYVEGMLKFRNNATAYPDANATLRISGGRVHGYSARDGILNMPFTTFSGMLEKDRNSPPFDLPQKLELLADSTGSVNNTLHTYTTSGGTLPVNFLTTNDITGGSSGSPVLNARGQLVGLAFDSNIEGVISDYYFTPSLSRTINVDIRYILFLMQEFANTDRLLKEIDITHGTSEVVNTYPKTG